MQLSLLLLILCGTTIPRIQNSGKAVFIRILMWSLPWMYLAHLISKRFITILEYEQGLLSKFQQLRVFGIYMANKYSLIRATDRLLGGRREGEVMRLLSAVYTSLWHATWKIKVLAFKLREKAVFIRIIMGSLPRMCLAHLISKRFITILEYEQGLLSKFQRLRVFGIYMANNYSLIRATDRLFQ
jgi:hypothetical protein